MSGMVERFYGSYVIRPIAPLIVYCISMIMSWGSSQLLAHAQNNSVDLRLGLVGYVGLVIAGFILPTAGILIAFKVMFRVHKYMLPIVGLLLNATMLLPVLRVLLLLFIGGIPA